MAAKASPPLGARAIQHGQLAIGDLADLTQAAGLGTDPEGRYGADGGLGNHGVTIASELETVVPGAGGESGGDGRAGDPEAVDGEDVNGVAGLLGHQQGTAIAAETDLLGREAAAVRGVSDVTEATQEGVTDDEAVDIGGGRGVAGIEGVHPVAGMLTLMGSTPPEVLVSSSWRAPLGLTEKTVTLLDPALTTASSRSSSLKVTPPCDPVPAPVPVPPVGKVPTSVRVPPGPVA